jgi:AraC-like DNA-binding protein
MDLHGMRLSLRSYGEHVATHAHDFYQVVLPLVGTLDMRIGKTAGSVSPRNFVVIGRGAQHAFRAFGSNRFVVLEAGAPVACPGPAFRALDGTLAELVHYAGTELQAGALAPEPEFHLAALLAGKIRRSFGTAAGPADPVEQARAVMAARYAERLTVADLADAAGLGVSQFHAVFRRKTGKAPAEMLADIRLGHAGALLRNTALPIAEIALLVGFSDQTALTRCFRRRCATTPHAVRRSGPP